MIRSSVPKPVLRLLLAGRFILGAVFLVVAILTIAFVLFSALPSDPARSVLGVNASEDAVRALRRELGYDRPVVERYLNYLSAAIRLEFGRSLMTRMSVTAEVERALAETLRYVVAALAFSVVSSVLLITGAFCGGPRAQATLVNAARTFTSVPSLILCVALGSLAVASNAFRFLSNIDWENFLTAVVALSVYPICSLTEVGITESIRAERLSYVLAARSFGLARTSIFTAYIARIALVSWLGTLSNVIANLVVGSSIVEIVFSLPGLGQLLVRSVTTNDYPMLQGIVVATTLLFLFTNLLLDRFLLRWLGTRTRS